MIQLEIQQASEKPEMIHEAARKWFFVRAISCSFVDRLALPKNGNRFFSGLLQSTS
jgi:hypothetical protein